MSLQEAVVAANRFGLGATPELIQSIKSDPRGWLLEQLAPETQLPAPLAQLPSTGEDQVAFVRWLATYGASQQRASQGGQGDGAMPAMSVEDSIEANLVPGHKRAVKARFDAAVTSPTPFRERLIHFWSNHFVVSSKKTAAIAMPPSFERDVARAHVAGRFRDMLMASSKHPAMLFYLDNSFSIGPNSKWGKNPNLVPNVPVVGRPEGLNENLAREILELHTVGVNGGYSQADVTSFARVITGWQTSRRTPGPAGFSAASRMSAQELFYFNADAHEPGNHTVMGKTYKSGGVEQGESVLKDLAAHPKTAELIATKLVRHFIADEPPAPVVKRVAQVFTKTDGDLREVCAELVKSPEAWAKSVAKWKRPEEYLISTVRGLGLEVAEEDLYTTLSQMGQLPYMQPGPDGWHDIEREWLGPDPIWKRLEWANQAATKASLATITPIQLAEALVGPTLSAETRRVIEGAESPAQGIALFLVSPEFLRR